jgi:DNA topoisomerase I
MSNTLVIVESPAKAKAIQKYLGKGFTVKACMGHFRDLPENKLGVDLDHGLQPSFVIQPKKKAIVTEIKTAAKKADDVLLAADPDREGEAICYHLHEILKDLEKPIGRVLFHEITPSAIREAVSQPGTIDERKVNAQIARRVVDRLVGFKVSKVLWEKLKPGLSAGRVQTVALRMICEREMAIRAFVPQEYWTFAATLEGKARRAFVAKLTQWQGKKAEIHNQEEADRVLAHLEGKPWDVASVEKKKQKRSPLPPFITSKLQQEAARLLKFPVRKTMSVAQRLYEGVDLAGGETVGLITYMRTDSTRLSPQAVTAAREYIPEAFGADFLPAKARLYAPANAAQDAHEAIRPTDVTRTPEAVKPFLQKDEYELYRLIWRRFVASQMADALFDSTKVQVGCGDALFSASGLVCTFEGFLKVYEVESDEEKGALPPIEEGESLKLLELSHEQKFTEPPPRFTEAALVKALEENGIGRPSTYADIIATIQKREYVSKDRGAFVPSDLGMTVNELLVKHFHHIFDIKYTASLEGHLDKVENGTEKRQILLEKFWAKLSAELDEALGNMADLRREGAPTDEICDKCGKPMVIKMSRFGRFLSCSGYPECKNSKPMADETPMEIPEEAKVCPKCGGPTAVRQGRFGSFIACERYPECKTTVKLHRAKDGTVSVAKDEVLPEKCPECSSHLVKKHGRFGPFVACSNYPKCNYIHRETADVPCPKCGKALAKRFTKRRKVFYGCIGYPKCDFVTWDKPIAGPCPKCKAPILVERFKGGVTSRACADKTCGWTE